MTATHDMMGTDHLEIQCDKGKIVVDNSQRATITRLHRPMSEYSETMDPETIQRIVRGTIDWSEFSSTETVVGTSVYGEDHARVLENFASAILFGDELLAPASDGLNAVRLSNAMLLSEWLQEEVPFDFDEDVFLDELNARIRAEGDYPERS